MPLAEFANAVDTLRDRLRALRPPVTPERAVELHQQAFSELSTAFEELRAASERASKYCSSRWVVGRLVWAG